MERITLKETGEARPGNNPEEVIIALSPAFGEKMNETIIGLSHGAVIREICAGIEEEGLTPRFIKVWSSTDLAIIASIGSSLSGSKISIGIQSRGTVVIHQKDLVPLDNLELLPQSPLYDERIYRLVGKNAAKYAKGENPEPIEILNDYMVPSKFLVRSTLMHLKETEAMDKTNKTKNVEITFV